MGKEWKQCDFILGGSQITADGDCNHEIKRRLLLVRKVMTNLDSIFKSRDITLPTKVRLVKATVFPVVVYGYEIWTVKKAESQKLMLLNCGVGEDSWESLGLQGDPVYPKGNQSWIFTGRTDAKAEMPILWPPDVKTDSLEKTLMLGKLKAGGEGDDRGWDGWIASLTWWTRVWVRSRSWWWTGKPDVLQSSGSQRIGHDWMTEFTELRTFLICVSIQLFCQESKMKV